jgi:hypothetical protein
MRRYKHAVHCETPPPPRPRTQASLTAHVYQEIDTGLELTKFSAIPSKACVLAPAHLATTAVHSDHLPAIAGHQLLQDYTVNLDDQQYMKR